MGKFYKNTTPLIIGSIISISIIIVLSVKPDGLFDNFKMSKNLVDHVQVLTFIGLLINIWFLQITYKQNQNQIEENKNNLIEQDIDKNFYVLFNKTFNNESFSIKLFHRYLQVPLNHGKYFNEGIIDTKSIININKYYSSDNNSSDNNYIIINQFILNMNFILIYLEENEKFIKKNNYSFYKDLLLNSLSITALNVLRVNKEKNKPILNFLNSIENERNNR